MGSNNPWSADMDKDDLPHPELSQEKHLRRMEELVNRPAAPPRFPENLPYRPFRKTLTWWQRLLLAVGIVFLLGLLAGTIALGVLLSKEHTSNIVLQMSRRELASSLSSVAANTVTTTYTANATLISTAISTRYNTTTKTVVSTFTPTLKVPACNAADGQLYLALNFCTMVNKCNATTSDVEANDCRDFCSLNPSCAKAWDDKTTHTLNLAPKLVGCCGWCGCFHRQSKNDVMMWPVKPGVTQT